ncbi:hypothetical protein MTR67_030652 [Solanum verrucosum]|uniref:Uncharacterized protein n=1 Tax=Solanum verrucosum TaxID=315347 RepID=A0AAF0TXW6_SOLVR|nr:hypothetical protein MTR67_030652 [Solanum verrucosum]
MDSVVVVREFLDMFPINLPGIPIDRDIDIAIDLEPGSKPISIPPYRMALTKLKELKDQLHDLFNIKEREIACQVLEVRALLDSISFLGNMVSKEGIRVDPAKIEAVRGWTRPTSVTEILNFIGLAGYYLRFVQSFSTVASPLIKLTRNGVRF